MTRQMARRLTWAAVVSAMVLGTGMTAQPVSAAADAPARKAVIKKNRHRMPKYYAKIVTDKQREAINEIQEQYQPKIEELETQLNALRKERDEKIAAVLTPEQKKQLEEMRATGQKAKAKPDVKAEGAKAAEPKPDGAKASDVKPDAKPNADKDGEKAESSAQPKADESGK